MSPPRLLYGLPAILTSPDKPVVMPEGEKCADAAAIVFPNHVATTWSGGADAKDKTDLSPLAGHAVLLLADRDAKGREVMEAMADDLTGMGVDVRVHLPEGEDKQDIANWLEADGAKATRARIEDEAKPWIETESHAIDRLAALSPMEYDRVRKSEAKRMGIRVGTLDACVRPDCSETPARRQTQADLLIAIANDECRLFAFECRAFADTYRNGHRETWAVRSRGFRDCFGSATSPNTKVLRTANRFKLRST